MSWPLAVATIGAGLLGREGSREANASNVELSHEMREWNAQMAREDRRFQNDMRSTQYSAAMYDLERAGLNPLIALGGPAASPGGSNTQMAAPTVENEMSGLAASAAEAARIKLIGEKQKQELTNMKTADSKMKAETEVAQKLGAVHEASAKSIHQDVTSKKPWEYLMRLLGAPMEEIRKGYKNPKKAVKDIKRDVKKRLKKKPFEVKTKGSEIGPSMYLD